jgi:S2P endopeptidase
MNSATLSQLLGIDFFPLFLYLKIIKAFFVLNNFREQVRVNGFGVFLMFIFPGAYVDLCSDHLLVLSPIRQLRIFCAGVWHNFMLVLFAVLLLQVHPYFVENFFIKGAHVTKIAKV